MAQMKEYSITKDNGGFQQPKETNVCMTGTPTPAGPELFGEEAERRSKTGETPPHTRHQGKAWVLPECNGSRYWGAQWLRGRSHNGYHRNNEKLQKKSNSDPLPTAAPTTYHNFHPLKPGLPVHMAFFTYTDNLSLSSLHSVFQRSLI